MGVNRGIGHAEEGPGPVWGRRWRVEGGGLLFVGASIGYGSWFAKELLEQCLEELGLGGFWI